MSKEADLSTFWRAHPEFIWGPALFYVAVEGVCRTNKVASYMEANGWKQYGFHDTGVYTAFAVLLVYAAHGWFATHCAQQRQIQSFNGKGADKDAKEKTYSERAPPAAAAVRTVAALLTSVVYAAF